MPKDLTYFLVQEFDPYKSCLRVDNDVMEINEEHVFLTFGLPKGEKEVKEGKGNDKEDLEFLAKWRGQFQHRKEDEEEKELSTILIVENMKKGMIS